MNRLTLKRIALFSSYFETQKIPYYVKFYLSQLRLHADTLIYITTDEKPIDSEDLLWLNQNVNKVMQVKNEGYDFGMWQKALRQHATHDVYDELCLVNDSCVCFAPLDAYFQWHQSTQASVTGMTMSNETKRHIQSFFITIKKEALAGSVDYLLNLKIKGVGFDGIISAGELGLSQYWLEKGFSMEGFFTPSVEDIKNPTYAHCLDLIQAGVPLVKRKLFKSYKSDMIRHLLSVKNDWKNSVVIDTVRDETNLSNQSIDSLFEWIEPYSLTLREKMRVVSLVAKKKLGLLS